MYSRELHKFARPDADPFERPPPATIRYFYSSSTSIDDPQAPIPPPAAAGSSSQNLQLRPFSEYDSTALDKAWIGLQRNIHDYHEEKRAKGLRETASQRQRASSLGIARPGAEAQSSQAAKPDPRNASGHRRYVSESQGRQQRGKQPPTSAVDDESAEQDIDQEAQGLTGRPFARAPSRSKFTRSQMASLNRAQPNDNDKNRLEIDIKADMKSEPSKTVAVGVARLHEVTMPGLLMQPIYWKPVNDISSVVRSTWFYRDTMSPVEVEVANMLELGYLDLRPWTQTWSDELSSACSVGALGEERIAHALWPEYVFHKLPSSRPGTAMSSRDTSEDEEDTPERRRKVALEAAAGAIEASTNGLDVDNHAFASASAAAGESRHLYLRAQVIYADQTEAYILRPSLCPSAYYGRRPLANYIKKGRTIGIPVVRGFDQKAWERLNPLKTPATLPTLQSLQNNRSAISTSLPPIQLESGLSHTAMGQVTDLILVIHGIGQKLSERVESYHFTHAMNAFRREVNVEMLSSSVRPHLRRDVGGLMILPVNWRSALSFDDGEADHEMEDASANQYNLQDITPESLPSVRSIISDVMLDIPYYLSHHQPKMIAAVIKEANRIFRTWCKNNPGFERYGRVHIIAHSLGSVMAMDILSRQPTSIDPATELKNGNKNDHFVFDTKNLFVCGSPAGFFLLLKKANLLPRRNRNTFSGDGEDWMPGVAGEPGRYGCLAVDNIYNIVNPYDPVAYRLNAAVDAAYAKMLKPALVPSAAASWFSFSNPFKASSSAAGSVRPPLTQSLPSNVELETHNFTREEIAEKRAYLLNDNGQIDFFLRYGGGPLEIQYLTMLGAHSSYWTSRDFVRFVVLETGRKPGRHGTLDALRAVKKKAYAV